MREAEFMENFTQAMTGEWEKAGICSEDDLLAFCREVRAGCN
jgi:hypothetical protein